VVSSENSAAPSRRTFLSATGAVALAGAAGLVSGCGSASHSTAQPSPLPPGAVDVGFLNHALDLKHYVIAAYTAAAPLLTGRAHAAAKQFLAQELSHASALITLIEHDGGTPNPPQSKYPLGHPRGRGGILRLLDTAENSVIAALVEIIPAVSPGSTRATLSSIVANDAQHVSVLRLALRRGPIPSAFVTGRE
jgi:Ferritin-like domain